jgi:hypothetical protein
MNKEQTNQNSNFKPFKEELLKDLKPIVEDTSAGETYSGPGAAMRKVSDASDNTAINKEKNIFARYYFYFAALTGLCFGI